METKPFRRRGARHGAMPVVVAALLCSLRAASAGTQVLGDAAPPAAVALPSGVGVAKLAAPVWTLNLGTATRGRRLEARFLVRNEGSGPLALSNAYFLGCSRCATVTLPPPLAPGAQGDVVAVIDTTELGGPTSLRVGAQTNDTEKPGIIFGVDFEVELMVVATPGYMRYSYVQGEPTGTITQILWAKDREDFRVLDVHSPYPFLKVEWGEASEDERRPEGRGRQWRVAATLLPEAPVGALRGAVEVTTNHDTDTVLRIPLSGFVRPVYAVTPSVLDFGDVEVASLPRRFTAYFTAFTSAGMPPTAVRTTVAGIRAEVKAVEAPNRYEIKLDLGSELAPGVFDGQLVIETADARYRRIEVPLKGRVKPAPAALPSH